MILAIDPGSAQSAFVLFDPWKQRIVSMGIEQNPVVLKQLTLGTPRMTVFAIERVASFGFCVGKEVFETCEWVGRFLHAAERQPITIFPVYRKQVVTHHTGKSTNGDKEIRAAMIDRFAKEKLAGCKYDLWSALAIAAYVCDKVTDTSK